MKVAIVVCPQQTKTERIKIKKRSWLSQWRTIFLIGSFLLPIAEWDEVQAQQPSLTFTQVIDLAQFAPFLDPSIRPIGIDLAYDAARDKLVLILGFPGAKLAIIRRNADGQIVGEPALIDFETSTLKEGTITFAPEAAREAGFRPGDMYVTQPKEETGVRIIKIDGDTNQPSLFATLPGPVPHFGTRGLAFDVTGIWGNALIVVNGDGKIYRLTPDPSQNPPSKVEEIFDLNLSDGGLFRVEGFAIAPLNFGPLGGHLIIGLNCDVLAVSPAKQVSVVSAAFPTSRNDQVNCIEDIDFVPENENFFAFTDSFQHTDPNQKFARLVVARLDQFKNQGLIGHLLVSVEENHQIWDVFYDGQTFVRRLLAEGIFPVNGSTPSGLLFHGEGATFGKVLNEPPKSRIDLSISQIEQCGIVTLDGSGSTDADNDPLTFKWELTRAPAGTVPRTVSTSNKFDFRPALAGLYRFKLTVTDSRGGTDFVETSLNVFPSLGCGFTPGKTDFDLGLSTLVHQIYEVLVDVTHARKLLSQNRAVSLIEDAVDRALQIMEGFPAEFAELFGLLDNLDEVVEDYLAVVLARLEDTDLTPQQAAIIHKIKSKLEAIQTTLLELRNELDQLRDTLDTGDPDAEDVQTALQAAREALNEEPANLDEARVNLNAAYLRLRTARKEQARILAKQRVIKKRFVEIQGLLPKAFAVENFGSAVVTAVVPQLIRLNTEIPLWVTREKDGSFVFRAESATVKGVQLEVFKLSGERVAVRSVIGSVISFQPTGVHGRRLTNGVYLAVITLRGKNQEILLQHVHKLAVLQE